MLYYLRIRNQFNLIYIDFTNLISSEKRNNKMYRTYILKISTSLDASLTDETIMCIDNMVHFLVKTIMKTVGTMKVLNEKNTLSWRDIYYATLAVFGEKLKIAADEGTKTVNEYKTYKAKKEKTGESPRNKDGNVIKKSLSQKCGLSMSVVKISKEMKSLSLYERTSPFAAIGLTCIVEIFLRDIILRGSEIARSFMKVRVKPRHLNIAISQDEIFSVIFKRCILSGGVVV